MSYSQDDVITLRDEAWAHLAGDNPGFDAKAAVARLDDMGPPENEVQAPDFFEAKVLATLGAAHRARRAQKPLYRLFKSRLGQQQGAEFEAFQARLRDLGEAGLKLEGLSFFDSFASLDHDRIWDDVRASVTTVSDLIGKTFLNSGTLLGVVREQGLIAHDDDVDLGVFLNAGSAEEAAGVWLETYRTLKAADLLARAPRRNLGVFKLKSTSGVKIDVFPAWVEAGQVYVYPHTFGTLSEDQVLPLATCPVTGLPIPKDAPAMLIENYGDDWRVPDAGFAFPWKRANAKFAAFLRHVQAHEAELKQ